MEINWVIIGILVLCVIMFVVFTVRKNQKEKKKLTDLLNNDFKKPEEDEPDLIILQVSVKKSINQNKKNRITIK